jgi:hypothetical protein
MKNNKCPVCSRRFDASDTKKRNSGSALRHNVDNTGNLLRSSGTGRQVLDENARIQKEDLLARHPKRGGFGSRSGSGGGSNEQRRRQRTAARAVAEAEESVVRHTMMNPEPNWIRDQTQIPICGQPIQVDTDQRSIKQRWRAHAHAHCQK